MGETLQFPAGKVTKPFLGLDAMIYEEVVRSIPWNSERFDRAFEETLLKIIKAYPSEPQKQ